MTGSFPNPPMAAAGVQHLNRPPGGRRLRGFATALALAATCAAAFGQDEATASDRVPAWLRGSGSDMQMRLRVTVLGPEGEAASDARLRVEYDNGQVSERLSVKPEGNTFEFWVPVGRAEWFRVNLTATRSAQTLVARLTVPIHDLRQAAIDGLELQLERTERTVTVSVLHDEQPVAGAHVRATLENQGEVLVRADQDGMASVPLMNSDRIHQLTAWSEDFRFGGYSFHRDPPRDSAGDEFQVELEQCRQQRIRLIDSATGQPLPNLAFHLTVGTGPPNYQFPGAMPDDNTLTTDSSGEAVCRWFPDWPQHYSYVRPLRPHALASHEVQTVNGVLIFSVQVTDRSPRKSVRGRVIYDAGPSAGFFVRLDSFQSGKPGSSDFVSAFTEPDGTFTVPCLPGATYCAYVNDARYVTPIMDGIPVPKAGALPAESSQNEQQGWEPELEVREGQPVQVVVVGGPGRKPVPFQQVQLSTPHDMSWTEDGRERFGTASRRWTVTTNRLGRTFTYALPGKEVEGSIYNPTWRMKESVEVRPEGITRLVFHRAYLEPRILVGQIQVPEGTPVDFDDLSVQAGTMDGQTDWAAEVQVDRNGRFRIETTATRFGVYARSSDGRLAGLLVVGDGVDEFSLPLQPASTRTGRLRSPDGTPISDQVVRGVLDVRAGPIDFNRNAVSPVFSPLVQTATTDRTGRIEIAGVPEGEELRLTVRTGGRFGYDRRISAREPTVADVDSDYVIDPAQLADP